MEGNPSEGLQDTPTQACSLGLRVMLSCEEAVLFGQMGHVWQEDSEELV